MKEHYIWSSGAFLKIVDIATPLYIIITSTKEDRKLLVFMTMESRCGICPVIRKILQSWHSLRTEREQQPMAEGRLYSLECATDFQPQKFSCTSTVVSPCGVGHGLCSSRQVSSRSTWLSPVSSRPHPNECLWHCSSPLPSPVVKARQIVLSLLTEEDNRRRSPKSFLPLKPLDSVTHSFIYSTVCMEQLPSLTLWPVLNFSFHSLFNNIYWSPTIHQVRECARMCKNE